MKEIQEQEKSHRESIKAAFTLKFQTVRSAVDSNRIAPAPEFPRRAIRHAHLSGAGFSLIELLDRVVPQLF